MSNISESDREAFDKDKQLLSAHLEREYKLRLQEDDLFKMWLVGTRALRAKKGSISVQELDPTIKVYKEVLDFMSNNWDLGPDPWAAEVLADKQRLEALKNAAQ